MSIMNFENVQKVIEYFLDEHDRCKKQAAYSKAELAAWADQSSSNRRTKGDLNADVRVFNNLQLAWKEAIDCLKGIDPITEYANMEERVPDWLCPTCGTQHTKDDLLRSPNYCEAKSDGGAGCYHVAEFIVTSVVGQIVVRMKACRSHIGDVIMAKGGNPTIEVIGATTPRPVDPHAAAHAALDAAEVMDAMPTIPYRVKGGTTEI
jgi:hypothetical protein